MESDSSDEWATGAGSDMESEAVQLVVPVIAEELHTGVRRITTGGVRVKKTVVEHQELIDMPLESEHVEVRRVVKNEAVAGPLAMRQEGGTTIVPVVKEVLIVQRQWVLTEEIHITKNTTVERAQESVTVRREEAIVERLDATGTSIGPAAPSAPRPGASSLDEANAGRKPKRSVPARQIIK